MVDSLTPQIILLKSQSADPITTYIDSPGGTVVFMERILGLLTSPDQDLNESCTLITVVTGRVASAGAEMLSSAIMLLPIQVAHCSIMALAFLSLPSR